MIDLYNGDCLELLKGIPDSSIDLVVIDPPYELCQISGGVKTKLTQRKKSNWFSLDGIVDGFNDGVLKELVRVMKEINIYVFCSQQQIHQLLSFFKNYDCKFYFLIWKKQNPIPTYNNTYLSDKELCLYFKNGKNKLHPRSYADAKTIYESPINQKDKKLYKHPTIKPLPMIETIIRNSSNEGDTILDCFMGSGTTGVACLTQNRNFIGMEINKEYFEIAKERIEEVENQLKLEI